MTPRVAAAPVSRRCLDLYDLPSVICAFRSPVRICRLSSVQGPPGTGKTTMLLALLNVLHNAATQVSTCIAVAGSSSSHRVGQDLSIVTF